MGLLDDAIKEHLELKRRRGADPSEVERLEREALGPVRRAPQATDEVVLDHQAAEELEYADEPEEVWIEPGEEPEPGHVPEYDPGAAHDATEAWELEEPLSAEEPLPAQEPGLADEEPRPEARLDELDFDLDPASTEDRSPAQDESDHDLGATAVTPPPSPANPPPAEEPGQETVEYDVESEGEESEDDDVLEETPEFLQDTPDHDRLWFEQRPPRDFDFDG